MIRIAAETSLPNHHESLPLRPRVRRVGWLLGILLVPAGLLVAARTEGSLTELVAPVLVVLGGGAVFAVLRCSPLRVTVGTVRIELEAGLLRHLVPTGSVLVARLEPASSWRRLYADEEIRLEIEVGKGSAALPTRNPAAMLAAIRGEQPDARKESTKFEMDSGGAS